MRDGRKPGRGVEMSHYRDVLWIAIWAFFLAGSSVQGQATLKLGDRAPALKVSEWVKGEPVDPAKGKGKHVYLLEFWATWCPACIESIPHLTEIQRKYKDRGLVVVGISSPGKGETLAKVKRFVSKRGGSMGYTVGYDGSGQTSERYLGGVRVSGIPWAFLVDRAGTLVWHGHPGTPLMDEIIDQVIKGTYDASEAILQEKLAPLFGRLQRYDATRNWDGFKSTVKTMLGMDPKNEVAFGALVYGYLLETDDSAGFREFVESHIAAHSDHAAAMNNLARALLDVSELDRRQPDLALRAAMAAHAACKGGDCSTVGTYARAVFQIGMVDRAIELQNEAIALAEGPAQRTAMEKVAEYYRICKALQSERL